MTEAELRSTVVEQAHARGWRVFSLPIAKTRRPVKDAVGYPDLTLARQRRVLFIELKTEHGVQSAEQMRWMIDLPDYHVVRPADLSWLWEILL
jgi:hypothetical protein